jgi:hypothetical protein
MAKKQLECPTDITTPPMKKCWSSQKGLQKTLTAAIFKNFECKDDCDLYVIVNLRELGVCPTNPAQKEFEVIVEIGCIRVTTKPVEYALAVTLEDIVDESPEQKTC